MTTVAATVTVLNNATMKIGTNNFELTVSKAMFSPTTPKNKFKGIGGNHVVSAGTTDWTCDLDFLQDWATATSLSNYILANTGTVAVADFYPKAGGPGYRASLLLEPGGIGGEVDKELSATVSLMVQGQPVLITP